jgi:hypothetical protein
MCLELILNNEKMVGKIFSRASSALSKSRDHRWLSRFYTDLYIDERAHGREICAASQYRVIAALKSSMWGGCAQGSAAQRT